MDLQEILDAAPANQLIRNTFIKADKLLNFYKNPVVSISGGADSDIMLDLVEKIRNGRPISYVFFDTGIEYSATKKHLDELEIEYGIKIIRAKAKIPVPAGCKKYGVPFLSKRVSMYIDRLQNHNFQWEDEPYEALVLKYPNCQSALKWWCNAWGDNSRFNIERNKLLKEFMLQNPPSFSISDKCCNGAKKETAKQIDKEFSCCIKFIGERRSEGGIRALRHHSCFDYNENDIVQSYRPLFFWTDQDKQEYKDWYHIKYSDCYEIYGMSRTGCAGCPFGSKFEDELSIISQYEPKLKQAVQNIFGESYEYTRAYKKFKEDKKAITKEGG